MKDKVLIKSLFPVSLIRYSDGRTILVDLQENGYEVRDKKTNQPITEEQYYSILHNNMGFWEIAHKFMLVIGEYVV